MADWREKRAYAIPRELGCMFKCPGAPSLRGAQQENSTERARPAQEIVAWLCVMRGKRGSLGL